jgi:hypothetical protein
VKRYRRHYRPKQAQKFQKPVVLGTLLTEGKYAQLIVSPDLTAKDVDLLIRHIALIEEAYLYQQPDSDGYEMYLQRAMDDYGKWDEAIVLAEEERLPCQTG